MLFIIFLELKLLVALRVYFCLKGNTFLIFCLKLDSTIKLDGEHGELFSDVGRYRCLVGKLIYLAVTPPDITYAVGVVSQYMDAPRQPHYEAVYCILRYLKVAPG